MKKRILSLLCSVAMLASVSVCAADNSAGEVDVADVTAKVAAFPGAEGGGMWTTGARGALESGESIEVYHVTSLADSGEGSFRDAVSKGNRIVVFDVSGYIDLSSNVNISHDNMTILGQTAPGDGITFRGNNIKVGANNVILRYLRFRVGSKLADGSDTRAQDGLEVPDNGTNIIIDHCSVSWGTDENLAAYAVKDLTVQYSIISEALNQSVHDKGEHGYAAIWGGVNMSVHHNLIASHKSRNPKIGTSETVAMTAGYTDAQTLVDMKNNVFYNWGDKCGYGTENGAKTYIRNNIYRPGPATPAGKRARIFELSVGQKYQKDMLGSVYAVGNKIDVDAGDPDYETAQKVNENNWQDDLHTGVYVDTKFYNSADKSKMVISEPDEQYKQYEADYPITLDPVDSVYEDVLNNAGATLPKRDKVDERVIDEVRTRTAPSGSKGSVGLLDDPLDGVPDGAEAEYDDRGYPIFSEETRPADYDTDGDGIADSWEDKMGLNKENPYDSLKIGPDGYTWLELFVEESIAGGKEPAGLTLSAEDKYYTTSDTITVTASEAESGSAPSNSWVKSYENGVVTVDPSAEYDTAAAVVASYDANNNLIDSKGAEVDKASGSANVGEVAPGSVTKVYLWSNLDAIEPLCEPYTLGGGSISTGNIADVEIYCNDKVVAQAEKTGGEWTANLTALPTGNNILTAKAEMRDGTYSFSPIKTVHVIGAQAAEGWTAEGEASFDGECYTLTAGSELSCEKSGDFKLVGRLEDFDEVGAGLGAYCSDPYEGVMIAKTLDENYEPVIIYYIATDETIEPNVWTPASGSADDYSLFEVERADGKIKLYAGTSLADLETNLVAETDVTSGTFTVCAFMPKERGVTVDPNAQPIQTVSKLSMLKLIETATNPKVEITNINDNDRIDIVGSEVKLNVTSDGGTPVTEIWVYLNGEAIAQSNVNIVGAQEVAIPLEFTAPTKGTLTVYAFDENLGRGEKTINVSISQDGSPWKLTDIGYAQGQAQTFAEVTDDFTFKLYNSSTGGIGGTSDSFGYMYQQFSGDNRVYYRSRLNSGSQLGLLIKNDLDADGVTYFFGGTFGADGKIDYQLMSRTSKGGNMEVVQDVTGVIGESATQMLIAEKLGDKLYIYQSENNPTVYKTKKLIASVDISGIGDSYYMGFGFVGYNPDAFIPDVGWVSTERIADETNSEITWDFDYGLDWQWQMQEKNVLRPSWTQDMGGNTTGIMAIEPTADYSGDRYIFREYIPEDGMTPNMSADVLLAGDEPALNVYFQTGDVDKAYKITFADDGKIYANGTAEMGVWDTADGWYNVNITTDVGETGETSAKLTVKKGDTAVVDSKPIEVSTGSAFRTQKNTEKKNNDVTNAVYFEPVSTASGKYYIDNIKITQTKPSVTVTKETVWYTFNKISAISGAFTVDGTTTLNGDVSSGDKMSVAAGAELKTGNKSLGSLGFTNRIRINGSKGKLTVPVKSGSVVTVYAASASSSEARALIINGQTSNVQALTAVTYNYTGADGTIEISSGSNIEISAISVEKVTITSNN